MEAQKPVIEEFFGKIYDNLYNAYSILREIDDSLQGVITPEQQKDLRRLRMGITKLSIYRKLVKEKILAEL